MTDLPRSTRRWVTVAALALVAVVVTGAILLTRLGGPGDLPDPATPSGTAPATPPDGTSSTSTTAPIPSEPAAPQTTPPGQQPQFVIASRALSLIADDPAARAVLNSPRTFVLAGEGTGYDVPADWQVTRTASFTSYARLAETLAAGRLPAGTGAVLYDNEGWALTPEQEQRDPATYMARAAEAVRAQGLTFIAAPAVDLTPILRPGQRGYDAFLATGTIAAAARVADVLVVQAQGSIPAPAAYARFVRAALAQARSVNPRVRVLAGVSTGPSGQVVTADQLRTVLADTRGLVDGYWVNIPARSTWCPRCGEAKPDLAVEFLSAVQSQR